MTLQQRIIEQLTKVLSPSMLDVQTADQVHFEATIVSDAFQGLSRVDRQRLIYDHLQPFLRTGELHALSLKTMTPVEWQNSQTPN